MPKLGNYLEEKKRRKYCFLDFTSSFRKTETGIVQLVYRPLGMYQVKEWQRILSLIPPACAATLCAQRVKSTILMLRCKENIIRKCN